MAQHSSTYPVFLDRSGRRWRRIRRTALLAGIITTVVALVVAVSLLVPPIVPSLALTQAMPTSAVPPLALSRTARLRYIAQQRLFRALRRHPVPPAVRPEYLPVHGRHFAHGAPHGNPIVAGFYVNWDDNSFASLKAHIGALDWVICEWAFLAPGGDRLLISPDNKVADLVQRQPAGRRPAVFIMVSNFDSTSKTFDPKSLRAFLTSASRRAAAVAQLRAVIVRYGLAGVTVDFEDVPDDLQGAALRFDRELKAMLAPLGRQLTEAIPAGMDAAELRRVARVDDYVLPMLFDEHYRGSDPGPVASQQWYAARAREVTAIVPPRKVVLMMGAYGYDWDDAGPKGNAEEMTFQEVDSAARENHAEIHFDSVSLNPYVTWTDPDSTDHVVWFLDGPTMYDEIRAGDTLGVAGHAIWRLGSEDGSIWSVLGRDGLQGSPDSLGDVPPGYDVEFDDTGEILQITATPTHGRRAIAVDPATGLVVGERVLSYATPWVVRRFGASAHRVALTFDDGPDGRWTPLILDTLRTYHAPATFFVIGENVDTHLGIMRRIYREGHEFGNHTYTHPNMAYTSDFVSKLEIDANERLLEAVLDRRSAFFRPPYFGDAEPTTPDELVPVNVASRRGYYTVGVHVDAEDWQPIPVDSIVGNVLRDRARGNVVLLHDGGGDRTRTLAALGPIIDSLRARGDTLVLVSELAGISRDQANPRLAALGETRRLIELGGFGLLGLVEWALYWVFMAAVVLGIGRLLFIGALAVMQRIARHQERGEPTDFAPPVSVIIPAYNEEKVIGQTIESLLDQEYAGWLEILVVDDGSRDRTHDVAQAEFGDHPRVRVFRKTNGGKASALDYGIARARGEIIVALDADTQFAPATVRELVQPLEDEHVGAVAGNAKVGNRINLVTRWQALEYVTSQNLDRRAFSLLDCITVVPGAVGAWRKSLVLEAGGFREATLAEDQDLTLAIRERGHSIAYADGAIGYTEAPDTLRALARQRFRWSFGTLQCAWKYRRLLFRRRAGSLGWIALPNVWLFQLLLPAISPIADLMFVWSIFSVWITEHTHGATYALTSMEQVMTYYAVFLLVDWLAAMIAFLMEPGEDRQLTWLIFLQRFAYRQVMYWVVVRSFGAALRGHVVGWGKLERKATVELPAA